MQNISSIILIFIAAAVLSCSTNRSKSQILLSNIETEVKKVHKIEHGEVIAKYDLAALSKSRCTHAADYGKIINDIHYNKHFISKVLPKCHKHQSLQERAKLKLLQLKNIFAKLHKKHNILNHETSRALEPYGNKNESSAFDNIESDKENHIKVLHKVDHQIKHIPIFSPQPIAYMSSPFGPREHPITKARHFHQGVDFAGPKSSPIYAAAYGVVASVNRVTGYGNNVVIKHNSEFKTRYAHLSKMLVKAGDHVIRGQMIALQGATGSATSDHLHFEVIFKDKLIDPMDFVADEYLCRKGS